MQCAGKNNHDKAILNIHVVNNFVSINSYDVFINHEKAILVAISLLPNTDMTVM